MRTRWPLPLRLLHAGTAVTVIVLIPLAWLANLYAESHTDLAETMISTHMAGGLLLVVATALRLALRLVLKPPDMVPRPLALRWLVGGGTVFFYVTLFALPFTGIAKLILSNADVAPFGIPIVPATQAVPYLARAMNTAHEWLGWLLAAAILLHCLAAIFHARLFGTHVLRRMW